MKAYGKEWNYNVYDCRYCLYWKGLRKGCTYEDGCCCDIPQTPPNKPPKSQPTTTISECDNCPYGRDSPCLGWCTKEAMRSVGLLKGREL